MVIATNLGFPRIGGHRELKKALEEYWGGKSSLTELKAVAANLRASNWILQSESGIESIPSNDFSFYDQVLDTSVLVGAIPKRFNHNHGDLVSHDTYFAMARGRQDAVAMEMTKWFDTNYHYIVPELSAGNDFYQGSTKIIDEFNEAKALNIITRPVLLGPVSYLLLSKMRDDSNRWDLLPSLLKVYSKILKQLEDCGAQWVQIDEPCLVLDIDEPTYNAYRSTAKALTTASNVQLLLTTYFGDILHNLDLIASLQFNGVHIDLIRGANQFNKVCSTLPATTWLSLGIVDGRNIWRCDLEAAENILLNIAEKRGANRLMIAPSCSLLHCPVDLDNEKKLDSEIKSWLAFAKQKLDEVVLLKNALIGSKDNDKFVQNAILNQSRRNSVKIHNPAVQTRMKDINEKMISRHSPFSVRIDKQQAALNLPLLPTTTIGSYPQTKEIRHARLQFNKGELSQEQYDSFLQEKTIEAMNWQDEIGIDVPVHGEFERNDMVEYFGEHFQGCAFTSNGWVQSYGSRCVKPPIIFGDVTRTQPITVAWSSFAQKHTKKPVKGMLTGPVTILQWSFVRNDQPRSDTCRQIALAIRDEVNDLEAAGIRIIQIDEPALREGLPLRKSDWAAYLKWSVDCFRLCSSGVRDETQIHTHMCYCEFDDIIESITALDADVISIETSRSAMELLDSFVNYKYPNHIGPGVYDIHSPRIPGLQEMEKLLEKALQVLSPKQVWVNPDCGLKTRAWAEVKPAIAAMVNAARNLRLKYNNL